MKIIKLQAENIKKIKAIEITPDSNLVQITGANAQGKTSVLDSIWYALGGKEAIGSMPIRDGEDFASIKIELDEFIVTRTFKLKDGEIKTSIFVENKDGAAYKSPQTMLNGLVGKLSFDPLEFNRLKPRDQFDLLCDICSINFDFDKAAADSKVIYARRTDANREAKELSIEIDSVKIDLNLSQERQDIQQIFSELDAVKEFNSLQDQHERAIENLREDTDRASGMLERQTCEINDRIASNNQRIHELKQLCTAKKPTDGLEFNLRVNEKINLNAANSERKKGLKEKFSKTLAFAEDFNKQLRAIDIKRTDALSTAKMPVEGLSIDAGQVCFNAIPFGQLSGSEKLKISLAIAAAANPKIRVIRIADGSLLDSASMDELLKFANDKDFQVWVERVDETGNVGICIEDGSVKKDQS